MTDTTTRHDYIEPRGLGFEPTDGGLVAVPPDASVRVPQHIAVAPHGVGLGPLLVGVPPDSRLVLDRVEYFPDPRSDTVFGDIEWPFGLAGVAGVAAVSARTESPEPRPTPAAAGEDDLRGTRRELLTAAAAVGALAVAPSAVSADGHERPLVEVDVRASDSLIAITVLDLVADVLPVDADDITVEADGAAVADVQGAMDWYVLDEDVEQIRVYVDSDIPLPDRVVPWARGLRHRDSELTATFEFEGTLADGDEIVLSMHPAFVEPVREFGGDGTVVELNGHSVPYVDEHDRHIGHYEIDDADALVYVAGKHSPEGDDHTVDIRLRASRVATLLDNLTRRPSVELPDLGGSDDNEDNSDSNE